MTSKILAPLVLLLALTACESGPTETNSNTNPPKASPSSQASPAPATVPSPEASPSTSSIKPGDKVKAVNGSFSEATVISVDEKSGRVTVRIPGQNAEKTIGVNEVVKH